jgi:hypothetical protein
MGFRPLKEIWTDDINISPFIQKGLEFCQK